jgi:hypothetical protein
VASHCFRHGIPPSARARFVRPAAVHAQGKVALFEDLYGNLRDQVQFADGR